MSKPAFKIEELVKAKREEILQIAARHGAKRVRIFGSVARNEAKPDSDVDFLVDMEPGRSLFDLCGLLMDFQDLFVCKVAAITEKGLHRYIRQQVLREAVPL